MEDLFGPNSSDEEFKKEVESSGTKNFKDRYEIEQIELAGEKIKIRTFNFHPKNANFVWPGNEPFALWAMENKSLLEGKRILEVGVGTGVLSIFLKKKGFNISTSDYNDPQVEENIIYNWKLNGFEADCPKHFAHTWGETFPFSEDTSVDNFEVILCTDCILYIDQYDNFLKTLNQLMKRRIGNVCYFAPGRRIQKEYEEMFFDMVRKAGYTVSLVGRRIFMIAQDVPINRS